MGKLPHIRDNRRIDSDETAFGISVSHGKELCKNGLRSKRRHFIVMKAPELWSVGLNALKLGRLYREIRYILTTV
jgi:hypothetical protein